MVSRWSFIFTRKSLEDVFTTILRRLCAGWVSRISRGELLQAYLVINVIGLVQTGKNFSCILPPLASQNYLLQSISVKLIYQFLYPIYGYLFFRCLEKVFEEESDENKTGNRRGGTTSQLPQKEDRKVKDRDD